jgi:hypothetical protein
MGRRPKVHRSAEEKFAILTEDLKSGKMSETCRYYEIAPTQFCCWKNELERSRRFL